MNNRILISIIIPSYNRADTVGQTIDSIIAQEVDADIEIIIGDDCSTDNAREVLLEYKNMYPDIIHLLFHEQNIGLGANWATCVKACKGKYICNCDNDDYWHNPHKLQIQLDYMERHLGSNVLITDHRTHNRSTGEIKECKAYIDRSVPLQVAIDSGNTYYCNATIMYRADFMKEHLPLDDFIRYHFYLQDWTAWMILAGYTDFDILNVSTATFGVETVSITRPVEYEKMQARLDKEFFGYKYVHDMFPNLEWDEFGWYSYANVVMLNLAYRKRDYKKAKEYAEKLNSGSLKVICARTWLSFQLYLICKEIKKTIIKK